ncbi:MAG: hypothetical protein IJ325_01540 [Clostridia bacterium]|nr:hypothetical protein [Clostridia bacterium]
MKKRTILSIVLSLLVMVLVPVLTVYSVLGADALGLMYIYIMVLNPIVSIVIGILSGWGEKTQWYLPLINGVIYLIGSVVLMDFDITWLIGAVVYFVLGIAAAYITNAIRKRKAGK